MRIDTGEPLSETLGIGSNEKKPQRAVIYRKTFKEGSVVVDEEKEKQKKIKQIKAKEKALEEDFFERGEPKEMKELEDGIADTEVEKEFFSGKTSEVLPPIPDRKKDDFDAYYKSRAAYNEADRQKTEVATRKRLLKRKMETSETRRKEMEIKDKAQMKSIGDTETVRKKLKAEKPIWVQNAEQEEQSAMARVRQKVTVEEKPRMEPPPPPPQPRKKQGFFGKLFGGLNNLFKQ